MNTPDNFQYSQSITLEVIKKEIATRKRNYRDSIALIQRAIEELESFESYLCEVERRTDGNKTVR